MRSIRLGSLAMLLIACSACVKDPPAAPSKDVPGCMDQAATNFSGGATRSDGSCTFSRVVFYVGSVVPAGALPVTVSIDGQVVGTVNGYYPASPPGNCTADFTAQKSLTDGRSHDWNARTAPYLPGGGFSANSGTLKADHGSECIKVRVF